MKFFGMHNDLALGLSRNCWLILIDITSWTYNSQWPDSLRMCTQHVGSTKSGWSTNAFRSDRSRKL